MMHKSLCVLMLILVSTIVSAQKVELLTSGTKTSLRGLSVVNPDVIWVSGSNGTVGLSVDGGSTWKWMTVKGFEKTEFRDIEAFDAHTAVIMGITQPACILRTDNGGISWATSFHDTSSAVFLDAMEFWNERSGIVIGDPIKGKFFIARTFDGGHQWRMVPEKNRPAADSGEACFASSGTNVRKLNSREAVFISGGKHSNIFIREHKYRLIFCRDKNPQVQIRSL